jgi:hypothetical protein
MNKLKTAQCLLGAALASALVTDAFAGQCSTEKRRMLDNQSENVRMTCRRNGKTGSTADVGYFGNLTRVLLVSSAVPGQFAKVEGFDLFGNIISGCSIHDTAPGGDPQAASCDFGQFWQGTVTFQE